MQRQHLSQRVLSLLLAFVMIITCAPAALAESTEAALMRLMKTEGTVSVTNAKGRSVKTRDDMRLSSGYGLETGEASYAWINLDDAKLVKMDAVSEIGIRKSGKKLDILLESGNLFFNVSKPLEEDETFTIRTSTMAVGVRGTCGWVKVIDQWTTLLYILEGTVTVTVIDPVTGEAKTETVKGGETVTCKVYPQDTQGSKVDIIRQTYTVDDIPGFVLVELVKDRPLCEKIKEDSGLDILGSGVDPEKKLKEDQEEVHRKLEEINKKLEEQEHNISKDPVWTSPVSDGTAPSESSGSDSGGSSDPGSTPVAPTETLTLTMPQTAADVNEALNRASVRQVVLQPGTRARASTASLLDVDSRLTVPSGKILTLQSGVSLTANEGRLLAVYGTLTVGGDFRLAGDLAAGSSGVIKSTAFKLAASVVNWKVAGAADSAGYYTLIYSPKGVYTVTFNANGGSVSPAQMKTGTDGRLTSLPTPTRSGHTFDGWFTAAEGGTQITTVTVFSKNTTVYAHWTENTASSIVINYDANGGTGSGTTTAVLQVSPTQTTVKWDEIPVPARVGYTFAGWYTAPTGGTLLTADYDLSDAYDLTKPVTMTIYAHWTEGSVSGVTWRYDEATKTLYIEGSGAMEDYTSVDSGNPAPWLAYMSEMQALVIGDGVTCIGENAFYRFAQMTSVKIGSGVTSIGQSAFQGCSGLTSVTIPNGVTSIGTWGFYDCGGLTSVTIPNSVTSIGTAAFHSCSNLKSVTIPNSVTNLERGAFANCTSLTKVDISSSITALDYGVFSECSSLTSVTIPANVTSIGERAFYGCQGLTHVTIPDKVVSIGINAFSNCSGLTSVTIPASVTAIDRYAFWYCAALADVYYGGTEAQWNKIAISDGNTPLLSATLHCEGSGMETEGEAGENVRWSYDPATKTLTISGTGPMYDYGKAGSPTTTPWAVYADEMRSLVIENGVTRIGYYAFYHCSGLTSAEIPNSVTNTGYDAFAYTGLTSVIIPDSVTTIDIGTFMNCTSLTSVTIPDSVTTIMQGVFAQCSALTHVTIPDSVTTIGHSAFTNTGLTSVIIPPNITTIESSTFSHTYLTSVTIPDGVTSINNGAFSACENLTRVTIPDSVTTIEPNVFSNCPNLTRVDIGGGVTSIGMNKVGTFLGSFSQCTSLTDVYYNGTKTQWNAITTGSKDTDGLSSATIHCTDGDITPTTTRSVVSYAPTGYADVPATASYAEAVRYCRDNGLMTGTSATTFSPDGTLTRAMMVTVLHRLAGKPFAYATGSFADVPAGKWYSEAISWASSQGIVNGYNPTTFGTNDPVTHEQVGLLLQRYSGDQSIQVTGAESPKTPATRAEVAMTLMNYAKGRRPGTLSEASAIDVMCSPSGIAVDQDGSLMVTDVYGKQLWKVANRTGTAYAGGATVLDLYGQPIGGYNDAGLSDSFFKEPWAIAPFLDGWAVSDTANNVVRLVSVSSVQTLNGATNEKLKVTNLGVAFDGPTGLASDDNGNLYVSDTLNGAVRRVNPDGGVMTVAKGLSDPTGLCWKDGVLYIAETGRNRIVKLEKGKVTTVAGSGAEALTDGDAMQAAFASPKGVAAGSDGSVYVADTGNGAVRVVKGGTVTTLAARDPEQLGGGLMSPVGLLVQGRSLYICDTFARRIFVYQLG